HVPSEEEIIDIGVVGERSKENFLPAFVNKIRGLKLPLPAISFKLPKLFFPASKIFLKRPSLTKRSQKVALTGALGVLLLAAVASTHLYRTRAHEFQQQNALLAQAKELLTQGQAVSSQDPQAATQYYRSAGDILGQITQNKQAQELSDELERTLALAYNLQTVTTQKAEGWPEIISKQIFELQADGIHALGDRGAILASDPAWQSITAIDGFGAAYGENLYLLDIQANQIHKYIALSTGYSRRFDYFTISVDLSQATDLAIDGAIYVLLNNGEVHKYLGGEKQDFRLSGFYPPIANAQAIFTTPEIEHIYVASENMILVFDKGGKYQKGFELNEQFGGHLLISDNEEALWFGKEDNIYTADLR
ncbi:hypothetical protein KKB83_01795, partial [Patescibacteria group bacterium]|nr:hypothetical protein [Patescibacteria group bacterium]